MIYFSKKELVIIGLINIILFCCLYKVGYLAAKLEKPKTNVILVQNDLNENLEIKNSEIKFNTNKETIFYVSSNVLDNNNDILNRIGIRFVGFKNNKNIFLVEICDSVNKKCIESNVIDRVAIKKIDSLSITNLRVPRM